MSETPFSQDRREDRTTSGNTTGQTLRDAASSTADTVREEGTKLADTARERAGEIAEQGQRAGAERAQGVARAIHRAAEDLEQNNPTLANMVHDAAGSIDGMARALRDRSPREVMHSVEDWARRQPIAFFGAATLAGFAIARFARSSAPMGSRYGRSGDDRYTYDRDTARGSRGDTGHDMRTAGTGASGSISGGAMPGTSGTGTSGTGTSGTGTSGTGTNAPAAPGWVVDESGAARPATLASASLGGAAAHRPGSGTG